jgi:hypothetical protein
MCWYCNTQTVWQKSYIMTVFVVARWAIAVTAAREKAVHGWLDLVPRVNYEDNQVFVVKT